MTDTGVVAAEYHRPVLVEEVVQWLALSPGKTVVDATVGGGGHARAMSAATDPGGELIGIDRDPEAVGAVLATFDQPGKRVRLIRGTLGELNLLLDASGVGLVDAIFADLGVSSHQLDAPYRGFSFRQDGPLDMRMDATAGESAAALIERLTADELANLLWEYGEERRSRRIASEIVRRRPITTTSALAEAVVAACGHGAARSARRRIHPATRTFQALRIAVNDEMGELERFLAGAPDRLSRGGRLGVISYHSLEDRRVKHAFRRRAAEGPFALPVRKAIRPSAAEIRENPRARSAKFRVLERMSG